MTVYEKPTCSTCRRLVSLLTERRAEFERIDYARRPLPESKLRELLRKAGLLLADVVRTKETAARALQTADDQTMLRALPSHSELRQYPTAERVDPAVSARAPERVLELLR
jgi:arsenate reductase